MIWRILGTVALMLILFGCGNVPESQEQYERHLWEDGVFWGAEAARSGAKPDEVLVEAYRLREEARRKVAEDKEAIRKIEGNK